MMSKLCTTCCSSAVPARQGCAPPSSETRNTPHIHTLLPPSQRGAPLGLHAPDTTRCRRGSAHTCVVLHDPILGTNVLGYCGDVFNPPRFTLCTRYLTRTRHNAEIISLQGLDSEGPRNWCEGGGPERSLVAARRPPSILSLPTCTGAGESENRG